MRFYVLRNGEPCPVELTIGGEEDLSKVGRWRTLSAAAGAPGVRDTLEFARLASKRWRYYRRSIATATSLEHFTMIINREPQAEVSLLMVAAADWFERSPVLGLAQCRRTYCHHLILEFLSVHPAIVNVGSSQVRGVGTGIVCGLAEWAGRAGIRLIWGEATAYSAPFYAKTLGVSEVLDHFFIRDDALRDCRSKFERSQKYDA